jgi:hypothetical protein
MYEQYCSEHIARPGARYVTADTSRNKSARFAKRNAPPLRALPQPLLRSDEFPLLIRALFFPLKVVRIYSRSGMNPDHADVGQF